MTTPADPTEPTNRRGTLEILLVHAEPEQCWILVECLDAPGRENIQVEFAHTVKDARAAVRRKKYNCVLVFHELPDGRGIDLIEDVSEELLTTPVIGLSSSREHADPLEYFRAGCADFFFTHDVMAADKLRRGIAQAMSRFHRRAMGTVIERRQLGDAVVKSQEGLIALARTDRLMGICNRGVFDDYFSTHHAEAVGRQGSYALCMIDVDNFKKYNDRYGHAAGDVVLRTVAQTLASTLRENDFIARYGGEEIVVLLDEVNAENAASVGNRLRRLVHDTRLEHEDNQPYGFVTVSVGIAVFEPRRSETAIEILERADAALYRAKGDGRNTVIVDDPTTRRMSA